MMRSRKEISVRDSKGLDVPGRHPGVDPCPGGSIVGGKEYSLPVGAGKEVRSGGDKGLDTPIRQSTIDTAPTRTVVR